MLFCWESASGSLCLPGALFALALLPLLRLRRGWLARDWLRDRGCEAV